LTKKLTKLFLICYKEFSLFLRMKEIKLGDNKIYLGDSKKVLQELPGESVDMIMTSPPYWALRDYRNKKQLGLEPDFNEYISKLCDIFDEVKRVLKKQGTCWVNIGDTYYSKSGNDFKDDRLRGHKAIECGLARANQARGLGLLPSKCLTLIPFRFAIEMVKRGWILRNTIIWYKTNCMPSSAKDRFTVDFEYLFLFAKNKKYYFKTQREPHQNKSIARTRYRWNGHREKKSSFEGMDISKMCHPDGRNKRAVWTINTNSFRGAHFAVYPEKLCEIPISAGCPKNGIVLDPFFGAGTTGLVALKQGKRFIGIDLNASYIRLAKRRIFDGGK